MKTFTLRFIVRSSVKSKPVKIKARLTVGREIDQQVDTGFFVRLNDWNHVKQKAEASKYSTPDEVDEINELNNQLNQLRAFIEKDIAEALRTNTVNAGWLAQCIEHFNNPEKFNTKYTLFSFIEDFISKAETRPSPKTKKVVSYKMLREYQNTFRYLKEYAAYKGKEPDFDDIDLEFYDDFMNFLQSSNCSLRKTDKATGKKVRLKLAANTIGKKIQTLKIFLNNATERGINTNLKYKSRNFATITEKTDSFHLNLQELDKFYKHDFSADPRLEKVRDLFIVACWTGTRFSDLTRLTPQCIKNGFFYVTQKKTGDDVVIPIHPIVSEIMAKYGGKLPPAISNQKFNKALQKAAEIAGIDAEIHKGVTRGGRRVSKKYHKYELLTTHCARRSFATNMYETGFPAHSIMAITGHKTEKSFLFYLKTTPEKHAKMLMEHWLNNMNHLKVV